MFIIVTESKDFAQFAKEKNMRIFQDDAVVTVEWGDGNLDTERFVISFLGTLAIDPDILGFDYIKYILERCIEEPEYYKKSIVHTIYPDCAKRFNTTPSRVERAIRHAIELSFAEIPERYNNIFNRKLSQQPNTSKFIAMMALHIQQLLKHIA